LSEARHFSPEASHAGIRRIALLGNSPPRLCGIATFTRDVAAAIDAAFPEIDIDLYAMNDRGSDHDYPAQVVCSIDQDELRDYIQAAHRINHSRADVLLIQHEYGIFGGPAGVMLLRLLDRVDAPVVTTLHTVLEHPNAEQRTVIDALARRSSRLIVMAEKGREILMRVHGLSAEKIAVVPHGAPDRPRAGGAVLKPRFGFDSHRVLITFGLLSPNKGIETMIRAMPAIVARHPDALYVVLGATHPHLVAQEGEAYRETLVALADELGVGGQVRFVDGFLEQEELLDYLQAADVYVTPYLSETQITSGTLSYAVALGKPVVSTPYWHAAELLADDVGILVPFGDAPGFATAILRLLDDPDRLDAMGARAYAIGRGMLWAKLADAYLRICSEAVAKRPVRLAASTQGNSRELHGPKLDAVERMTDACGMIQHSIFSVPDRHHGYCVDDNCRALMLMHRIDDGQAPRAAELAKVYASFVQHAWNGDRGRFRNFMAFDRNWLEDEGSEDSFGRSVWTLGDTVAEGRAQDLRHWALHLFDQVAPHALELDSLRTRAFAILGAEAVLRVHPEHAVARRLVVKSAETLWDALREYRREGWTWFEPMLAYDNARIPEALIRAARLIGNQAMLADAIAALEWLDRIQTVDDPLGVDPLAAGKIFRAVGTDSFGRHYSDPLPFDQQPLEAWATVDAAIHAFEATGNRHWQDVAWRAYAWYLGANDLGIPIASPHNGGCFDGLMSDRVNLNQGAESILAFQFACAAMTRAVAVWNPLGLDAGTAKRLRSLG
jgi:glycosyltransferase involved in cell wall biosynthesis